MPSNGRRRNSDKQPIRIMNYYKFFHIDILSIKPILIIRTKHIIILIIRTVNTFYKKLLKKFKELQNEPFH